MTRYIPERTIDSLLAIETVRHDPYSLIWSPSNTRGAVDHGVLSTGGFLTVFESKAVDRVGAQNRWTVPIPVRQLHGYAALPWPVYYVVLGRPAILRNPSSRLCEACNGEWCRACCRDARSWAFLTEHVRAADVRIRLQPWFCHWAWVIDAQHLRALHTLLDGPATTWSFPPAGVDLAFYLSNFGGTRLCHFLSQPLRQRAIQVAPGDSPIGIIEEVGFAPNDDEDATPPLYAFSDDTSLPEQA